MSDDRAAFEAAELAGLAWQHGARRETRNGINFWRFPPWLCPDCTLVGGPDTGVLPGCGYPLARHGPIEQEAGGE